MKREDSRQAVPASVLFAAGAASGVLQTIVWHPLDLLKTRMQVQDARVGRLPVYHSLTDACFTIFRSESWRGFLHGMLPNVVGSGLAWGLQMSLYSQLKRYASNGASELEGSKPHASRNLACSLSAGCLTNLVVHPIFLVKVRMQLQVQPVASATATTPELDGGGAYRHSVDAARRIVREEGLGGLYRGFAPSMLLVSHGAILLMTYDQLRYICPSVLAASFMAKIFATIITYPTQVLRAVMQQRPQAGVKSVPYTSMVGTARTLWRHGGPRAFYRGIFAQMLRTVPQSMAFFSIYEFTLKHFTIAHGVLTSR